VAQDIPGARLNQLAAAFAHFLALGLIFYERFNAFGKVLIVSWVECSDVETFAGVDHRPIVGIVGHDIKDQKNCVNQVKQSMLPGVVGNLDVHFDVYALLSV
jgi:hypothetical protein